MYAVFPWHDPKEYPGCVEGLSAALGMPISTVKSNAYKARGPSANACRTMIRYLEYQISTLQLLAWELEAYAKDRERKAELKPGAQALRRYQMKKYAEKQK